jgi:hypothetical protein
LIDLASVQWLTAILNCNHNSIFVSKIFYSQGCNTFSTQGKTKNAFFQVQQHEETVNSMGISSWCIDIMLFLSWVFYYLNFHKLGDKGEMTLFTPKVIIKPLKWVINTCNSLRIIITKVFFIFSLFYGLSNTFGGVNSCHEWCDGKHATSERVMS